MTREDEARILIKELRKVAEPVGPLHAAWDTIFALESALEGSPAILELDEILGRARALLRPTIEKEDPTPRLPGNWMVEGTGDEIHLLVIGEEGRYYAEAVLNRYSAIWLAEQLLSRVRQGMERRK